MLPITLAYWALVVSNADNFTIISTLPQNWVVAWYIILYHYKLRVNTVSPRSRHDTSERQPNLSKCMGNLRNLDYCRLQQVSVIKKHDLQPDTPEVSFVIQKIEPSSPKLMMTEIPRSVYSKPILKGQTMRPHVKTSLAKTSLALENTFIVVRQRQSSFEKRLNSLLSASAILNPKCITHNKSPII